MKEIHKFTSDEKIAWWGYGEWVEEPDLVEFEYNEINCKICRVAEQEPYSKEFHMFGGYLCGYVQVPVHHPYHHKKYEDMDIDCHFGLTFGEVNIGHWIGFYCGHSGDLVPSIERTKIISKDREELLKKFLTSEQLSIFKPIYRNIKYCIDQCRSMVDQLLEITTESSTGKKSLG